MYVVHEDCTTKIGLQGNEVIWNLQQLNIMDATVFELEGSSEGWSDRRFRANSKQD
jgi:hypothetical protein